MSLYADLLKLAPDFLVDTPIQKLEKIGKYLGLNNLYMKRDDLTDFYCGKTRHAKLLMAWLSEMSVESVELIGPGRSNAMRVYGMALKRVDIPFRYSWISEPETGNGKVAQMLCGEKGEFPLRYDEHKDIAALGYIECAEELLGQMLEIDRVYLYSYDGGWIGLSIGFNAYWQQAPAIRKRPHIVAVRGKGAPHGALGSTPDGAYLFQVYRDACKHAGYVFNPNHIPLDKRELLPGYGDNAIDFMLNNEGILLDPIYTGPAFQALMDDAEDDKIGKDEVVVFINTGGFFLNF